MSNEVQIETFQRDNMDEEIHTNSGCHTESREYTYTSKWMKTVKLLIIFMVCNCEKKCTNPLIKFDIDGILLEGECVDLHRCDKGCYYERVRQYDNYVKKYKFSCHCRCRQENRSLVPSQ